MAKKPKILIDGMFEGRYVKAWKEVRGRNAEIVVQIWNKENCEGEPDGDWGMPGVLGLSSSISTAMSQTPVETTPS